LLDLKAKPLKIYIGDDQTDEDAFKVLGEDDISIRVGYKKGSKAQYFCKGSSEVLLFLKKLVMLNEKK
jgi:trehalose 6-phosphate phosphatase